MSALGGDGGVREETEGGTYSEPSLSQDCLTGPGSVVWFKTGRSGEIEGRVCAPGGDWMGSSVHILL